MENAEMSFLSGERSHRLVLSLVFLSVVGGLAFVAGLAWSRTSHAADRNEAKEPRIVYPKRTELDFEGMGLEGEAKSPGEFYFQHRKEEKFDSLVKRRRNFHREMLRDAVLSK